MANDSVVEREAAHLTAAQWTAYAAGAWAVIFAGLSFFWAAGGRTGLQPLEQAGGSAPALWVVVNLATGALKLGAGVLVAWYPRAQTPRARRLLAFFVWGAGVFMLLYGVAGLVSDALHVSGVIHDPASQKWFFYYLVLWDPWWTLGGVLFLATGWLTRRQRLRAAAGSLRLSR